MAKSRVSVFLKRSGNMQLHVSDMFTFCGNFYTKNNKFIPKTTDSLCNDLRVYFSPVIFYVYMYIGEGK